MSFSIKYTILIAENFYLDLKKMKKALEMAGFTVVSCYKSSDIFNLIFEVAPDMIVLATDISGADSFKILDILKCSESTKNIPVILSTFNKSEEEEERALNAGAEDYIQKPVDINEFLTRVNITFWLLRKFEARRKGLE